MLETQRLTPPEAATRALTGVPWIERVSRAVFAWRRGLLLLFIAITLLLGVMALRLRVDAGFTKMIPLSHPYMQTFLKYQSDFGGANRVLVVVKNHKGDIYQPAFLETLRKVTDEVFYVHGIERSSMASLFTANVRYTEVVEDGFRGGTVVDADFAGQPDQIEAVRERLLKSDWIGRLVSNDQTAAMVVATLQETDPVSGRRLDLEAVGRALEKIRTQYEKDGVTVHIIGFAKAMGDIAEGAGGVLVFFAVAFLVTAGLLRWYSGSTMLTLCALMCALVPVIWLLGLLPLLGLGLDPMSILVPFLIFSIGVSHAVQMTNAWKLEVLRGASGIMASKASFEKLFVPGAMALLANALGFIVIALVPIEMVRELAITATLGVSLMIITNKLLLPILLSYMRLSAGAAKRLGGRETSFDGTWQRLAVVATPRGAWPVIAVSAVLLGVALWGARGLQIGDLGSGVPELRAESRYNRDVQTITEHFAIGVDVLQVIVEADGEESPCIDRHVIDRIDALEFDLRQRDEVASVRGLAGFVKGVTQSYAETSLKWFTLPEDKAQIAQGVSYATRLGNEFMNSRCSAMPVSVFTKDHQAGTIERLVAHLKEFQRANEGPGLRFQLASGNVGVMAATNEAVAAADKWVNLALFTSVTLLCLLTFRSITVTLCVIVPLALVTLMCNALMAWLGIGVKVNTLPVVALGVGVGVDYGIYLFESAKHEIEARGLSLRDAMAEALKQRGTASVFTAVTMTTSVATWMCSALKFQADMGVLLSFMFFVNMLAAVLLLPALAAVLVGNRLARRRSEPAHA